MKPQGAERADGRFYALQEWEPGCLVERELFIAQLLDNAAEGDDRLVGFVEQLS
jgi:hypothetical protein